MHTNKQVCGFSFFEKAITAAHPSEAALGWPGAPLVLMGGRMRSAGGSGPEHLGRDEVLEQRQLEPEAKRHGWRVRERESGRERDTGRERVNGGKRAKERGEEGGEKRTE